MGDLGIVGGKKGEEDKVFQKPKIFAALIVQSKKNLLINKKRFFSIFFSSRLFGQLFMLLKFKYASKSFLLFFSKFFC